MNRTVLCLLVVLWLPIFGGNFHEISGKEASNHSNSFCIEGKTWNYILWYLDNEGIRHEEPCSYVVQGDSAIDDTVYKKVYCQKDDTQRLSFMMREEDGKAFKRFPESEEQLLFDFKRDDIGVVYTLGEMDYYWMIHTIDTIQVNNRLFRRYDCFQVETAEYPDSVLTYIEDNDDVAEDFWVEGIGTASAAILADGLEIPLILPGYKTIFVSCYENNECIFTAADFNRPAYTSDIRILENNPKPNASLFDLQGRPVKEAPKHGIYVKDGRKVIR